VAEPGSLTAVVTGSTKGIGRAIALALVQGGSNVVVSGRAPGDAARVARELNDVGPGSAFGVACDVREPDQCRNLIAECVAHFGGLDVLVNNAGLGRFAPVHELSDEDWDAQIRTNLDGVFHCSKAAVPHLLSGGGGWILNIGSLAGKNSFAGGAAYNASKFGLLGLSEAMMLDLRQDGVRVSCIMPGSVNTHFFGGEPDPGDNWRLADEDIARVVLDLLSFPDRALPSRIEIRPSRPPVR
jgi:3-oxoacyl-[acyl-carrier protein] reductase